LAISSHNASQPEDTARARENEQLADTTLVPPIVFPVNKF